MMIGNFKFKMFMYNQNVCTYNTHCPDMFFVSEAAKQSGN
jgi:hypothetical protein